MEVEWCHNTIPTQNTVFPQIDLALEMYSPSNSIRSILPYKWNNDRPQIVSQLVHAQYMQSRHAPHAALCISKLTAEVLAALTTMRTIP